MNTDIVSLQPSHFDALWQVFDCVAREKHYLASQHAPEPAVMRGYLQAYVDHAQPYYVALVDGQVSGWCSIQPVHGQARAHVGMLGMGLLPIVRGQGIGRRLMQAAVNAALAYGFTRIELSVRADNIRAIALYERMGFVHDGLLRDAFCVDNMYFDLHTMALLRSPSAG
jgi:ribosomal protein S18 acetylase RimI-like enzyme